jgi:1-deoxy-D-xylulose-5-phosphate synthase
VKPIDEELVCRLAATHECIVTLEENVVAGGAGSAVSECLAAHGIARVVNHVGIPDRFVEHGSREDCLAMAGLDAAGIEQAIGRLWPGKPATRARAGGRHAAG